MSGATNFNTSPELAQILSARQALRILDAAISRTESRLRTLPAMVPSPGFGGGTGGGGSSGGGSRPSLRNKFFGVERGGVNFGPASIDKGGLGLNKGFLRFGGAGVSTMVGFHITGAIGNQAMDLAERDRELRKKGASPAERIATGAAYAGGSFLEQASSLSGVSSVAEMALRGGGFTKEGAAEAVRDVFENIRTLGRAGRERNEAFRAAIAKSGAEVRKKYNDAYTYLRAWTPDDFDVEGTVDREDLRAEMLRINQGRLEAWMDDANNSARRKAARDSRGD